MRIGLVLGAGGSAGLAYHGAVLGALADVTAWDPRTAAVIVGTSAGSISAAMLRGGLPAGDLMRISEGTPLSAEGARLAALGRPHLPRAQPGDVLHMRPVADLLGAVHGIAHVRSHSLGAWMAALLPSGGVATDAISTGIDALHAAGWPSEPLWVCAVRLRDGKRVVFGRPDAPDVPVGQAVAASCAVPAYFRPVSIDGKRYIDGGVRSFINADLVARDGPRPGARQLPDDPGVGPPDPGCQRRGPPAVAVPPAPGDRRPAPDRRTGRRHRAGAGGGPGYGPQPPGRQAPGARFAGGLCEASASGWGSTRRVGGWRPSSGRRRPARPAGRAHRTGPAEPAASA